MIEPHIPIWNAVVHDLKSRDLSLLGPEQTRLAVKALVAEIETRVLNAAHAVFAKVADADEADDFIGLVVDRLRQEEINRG